MNASQKKGKLYLIPTPLSENTLDKIITAELNHLVENLNVFLVENVRTARRFISSLKLGISIENLRFEQLDKNTSPAEVLKMCDPLLKGQDIGVMSEAGCPGIADPGNMAVNFAHAHDVEVTPLVGPSSIFMALMASGFNGQSFTFHGYLPIEKQKRQQKIRSLEKAIYKEHQTQIFIETPYRNEQMFIDLVKICKPYTRLCVARDITGSHELVITKSIKDWKKTSPALHKIPTVFLIYKD